LRPLPAPLLRYRRFRRGSIPNRKFGIQFIKNAETGVLTRAASKQIDCTADAGSSKAKSIHSGKQKR
jgi:hypothetical protein